MAENLMDPLREREEDEGIYMPLQPRITDDPDAWATPNTPRGQEIARAKAQRSFRGNLIEGYKETALSETITFLGDETAPLIEEQGGTQGEVLSTLNAWSGLLMGDRAGGNEDYSEKYEKLTTGIPSQFHEEIIGEPNEDAAQRARARIVSQLQRANRSAMQQGLTPSLAMIAGSFVDIDAPLMLLTGGGFKAAAVSRKALQVSKAVGMSPKAALRSSSIAVGASGGLQSGLLVGAGTFGMRETADWTVVAELALSGMAFGAAMNPLVGGDLDVTIKAARDELHNRVATDHPDLTSYPEVLPAVAEPIGPSLKGEFTAPDGTKLDNDDLSFGPSTVGAAQTQHPITPMAGNVSDDIRAWGASADQWRGKSDWKANKIAEDDEWWAKVAMSGMFNVTTNNWRTMYRSDSSVMNWLLGNVYESPNGLGRGRYTAAAGSEMYHRRITQKFVQPVEEATLDWARRNNAMWMGATPSRQGVAAFNREVQLELNDRLFGRTPQTPRDRAVIKAANAYDAAGVESIRVGKGDVDELAIDGFENITERSGYSPQIWNGRKLMELESAGVLDRKAVVDAMATAYRTAGMAASKDAHAVAKAVVDRAVASGSEIDTSLVSLLSGDGREWLNQSLERNGMSKVERETLMARLTGKVEERGQEGFTKSRNDIDISTPIQTKDGSDLKVVDLMDNNLHTVWQRYARRMAGSASLARVGITNRAHREQIIQAAQAQQRALGEEVTDGDMMRAMFSNFNGGPVHGYGKAFGYDEGVAPVAALAKRMTNLSLLGKLGFAQLAETGAAIAATGYDNWLRRGVMSKVHSELAAGNKALLDDLAFITGDLGMDHKLFSEHLDMDDMNASDRGALMENLQGISQKATYVQSMVSGFNHVRGWQQRVTTAAMVDKIFRTLKSGGDTPEFRSRMWSDLGLNTDDLNHLHRMIEDGTIEFKTHNGHEFVNRINADKWDTDFQMVFGSAMTRNMNQLVQKSMAGEQDTWMSTTVGSLLTHLKTFPLQAMQKQFVRNMRHSDAQTLNTVWMGLATAGLAIAVRDGLDGKERTPAELAKTAFGYSNLTGWVPMVYDPTMTMLGLEDARINQYGPHSDYTPATVTYLNRTARLPGAAWDTMKGTDDYYDRQAMKALPFANLVGLHRLRD